MLRESEGDETMRSIAGYVREGAMAYLKQQYKVVFRLFVGLAIFLAILAYGFKLQNEWVPFAFLTSGFFSGLAGFFGMKTATSASARTAEAARHGHAIEASLAGGFQVLVGLACVAHATVFAVGAFGVHVFRVREDGVRGDVACDFEHAVVVVHSVGKIFRRIVEIVLVSKAVFLELHDALHQRRAFKVELGASSKKSF